MKGWKVAILIIVALFATLFAIIYVPDPNPNPITGILIQVVSSGLFIALVLFFFYLAGRVYLKETHWS